ncbi:MAG: hypothetical protein Q7T83_00950 [Thermodesulfovibrionales bacterium]|nr:hypothetical protein [Thermodesulfovibrionales bacterium]
MEYSKLALEYLKVLFSAPVVSAIIVIIFLKLYRGNIGALIDRINKIKLPGGSEISNPQLENLSTETSIIDKTSHEPQSSNIQNLQEDKLETIKSLYTSERARAYFWEYNYLNYYLVPSTQNVLSWLASLPSSSSLSLIDNLLLPLIPDTKERQAILSALEKHYLISIENNLLSVTPKGIEYLEWKNQILSQPKAP